MTTLTEARADIVRNLFDPGATVALCAYADMTLCANSAWGRLSAWWRHASEGEQLALGAELGVCEPSYRSTGEHYLPDALIADARDVQVTLHKALAA